MQRRHSPTTWRHPKENDTMGSTYSWGNLAPWQVCVGWEWLLRRKATSHCDWPCQVATLGCKRRRETIGFFFVPQVIIQTSLSIFVPYSLIWLYTQVITAHYHGDKQKKTSQTETAEQIIIFNTACDEFPLFLWVVLKCFQDGDLHRLQSSADVFMLSADNPEGRNAYFKNLSWLQ